MGSSTVYLYKYCVIKNMLQVTLCIVGFQIEKPLTVCAARQDFLSLLER